MPRLRSSVAPEDDRHLVSAIESVTRGQLRSSVALEGDRHPRMMSLG
ncbi:hypothetical protein [Streptomyces sp. rh34]|nr:hypothetical protein [Streptomyces sp. rh34]